MLPPMQTVTIKNANGEPALINACDFDPETHELFDAPAKSDGESTIEEVLAMAEAEGVHFKTFQAAAVNILGDNAPTTKPELIEALKAKAEG